MHLQLLGPPHPELGDEPITISPLAEALERAFFEPELVHELAALRREKEELQTELVIARRWVEILAREVESLDARLRGST